MTLVLASGSATRQGMLAAAGVTFAVDPADLDEAAIMNAMAGQPADAVALRLAQAKALTVSARHPRRIVLGADTVLVFRNRLVSKAPDMVAARWNRPLAEGVAIMVAILAPPPDWP